MKSRVTSSWKENVFENDKVFLVYRAFDCRQVLFHRSTWEVCPVSLPTLLCVSFGNTLQYTLQKSLKVRHVLYEAGMRSQSILHDTSLRSPRIKATTWRVLRQMAIHSQHLSAFFKTNDHISSNSKTSSFWAGSSVSSIAGFSASFFWAKKQVSDGWHRTSGKCPSCWGVHDKHRLSLPSSLRSTADYDAVPHVYCSLCTNTAADLEHYARFSRCSRCHSCGIGGWWFLVSSPYTNSSLAI